MLDSAEGRLRALTRARCACAQLCILRFCALILRLAAGRPTGQDEALSFFVHDEVNELLHIDLASTPPDTDEPELKDAPARGATDHRRDHHGGGSRESAFKLT